MIRLSTLFWLVAVATAGFAMFAVKYEVQSLADQLAHTVEQADDTGRDLRVLDAEWAYLNRPDALAQMNQRFLSLVPIATKQLRANVADIPMRPAPPPPSAPPPAPAAPPAPLSVETVAATGSAVVAVSAAGSAPVEDGAVTVDDGVVSGDAAAASSPPFAAAARPASPPATNTRPLVRVALATRAAPTTTRSVAAKSVAARSAARAPLSRRPASLDALITQISESR